MTESTWTSGITTFLRTSGCLVFKLADGFTTGVPDLAVIATGHTTWLEMKFLKVHQVLGARIHERETQWLMMKALQFANDGRAYYVVRDVDGEMHVLQPSVFDRRLTNEEYFRDGIMITKEGLLQIVRG